jgi:hypothetical protein
MLASLCLSVSVDQVLARTLNRPFLPDALVLLHSFGLETSPQMHRHARRIRLLAPPCPLC